MSRRRRTVATLAIPVTVSLLAVPCTRVLPGPQQNASAFLSNWTAKNWQGMRLLTDNAPATFTTVNQAAFTDLGVRSATFTAGAVTIANNTASEPVTEHITLAV